MEHKNQLPTASLQSMDSAHHLHPFTDTLALSNSGCRVITHADGVYIWDSEGHKMLDGMAGLWCVNIGYGRQSIADVAAKQLMELPYYNSFFQCSNPPAIQLAKEIAELAPAHMNKVFFTSSGSESNDTNLRLVHRYWQLKGQPNKKTIISRKNGYHGSTIASACLGGMNGMHEQIGSSIPNVVHIQQPYWYGEGRDLSPEEFGIQAAKALEDEILALGEDNVAAFIAEPIQGAGGVIVPPDTYWPEIKKILAKYDILFILDEVICGFGRTGCWFAAEYYDLQPDFITIAKGMTSGYAPMGGVIVADRVSEVIRDSGEFTHGYTYSGHPVSAAIALENIRLLKSEGIIENVSTNTGPYLQKRLRELKEHPLVGEVRGLGMLGAIELVVDKQTRPCSENKLNIGMLCREHSIKNGLVMRAVGDTMIVSPPLTITRSEIDELIEKALLALNLTMEQVSIQHA